ncbi:hypothetical protein L535_2164 [Bordetella bronchiseptica SBL-F6116]|nr:hypothetical protein L535_2164 [Bordetella bronchiseptica SBL-F6116]
MGVPEFVVKRLGHGSTLERNIRHAPGIRRSDVRLDYAEPLKLVQSHLLS